MDISLTYGMSGKMHENFDEFLIDAKLHIDTMGRDEYVKKAKLMSAWMDNYLDALREMDEQTGE